MTSPSATLRLVTRVRRRLCAQSAARRAGLALAVLGLLYGCALVATRLLGLGPDVLRPGMAALLALPALGIGALVHRRWSPAEAARRIDQGKGSKDLVLSALLAESAGGAYAPLVQRSAEVLAAQTQADEVIPFAPARPLGVAALALALLAAGTAYLPRLDPFGRQVQDEALRALKTDLVAQRKAIELRLVNLARPEEGLTQEVRRSLDRLKQSLDGLKPMATNENQRALANQQKKLGDLWKKVGTDAVRDVRQSALEKQTFGLESAKTQKWKEELDQGSTAAMRRELEELRALAKEMAQAPDEDKRAEANEELQQRLRELESFAKQNLGESPVGQQLTQAMNQLKAAAIESLSQTALDTLQDQLQLTQQDLESLAESLQNLQQVEDALQTLQQAQQCNRSGKCDGGQTAGFKELAEYAKWYAQAAQGQANLAVQGGPGMREPGQVKGGLAAEDPGAETGFTPERNPGRIGAGKVLLEWKTRELAPTGAAREEYARNVHALKQDVSAAILEEQIPPGYHGAIQHYFDRLPEPPAANPPATQDL